MGHVLMGVEELETIRRAALLLSLAEWERTNSLGMGKMARAVRAALEQSVSSHHESTAGEPVPNGAPPRRTSDFWEPIMEAAFGTAYRMTQDVSSAEDIRQVAMVKTLLRDWKNRGAFGVGALIRYARKVAFHCALRMREHRSQFLSFVEEGASDSKNGGDSGLVDFTPTFDPTESDHLDLLLNVPVQLGQIRPKDGLLVFADLVEVPRDLLAVWLNYESVGTLNTAICRAWKALETAPESQPLPRMDVKSILRKLEPFGLALAEAAMTSKKEWPDDDPSPPGGGGSKKASGSTDSIQDGEAEGSTRGDAMTYEKNDPSALKSPLAMLLRYAARTQKRVPVSLLVRAELEGLDEEISMALRKNEPEKWKLAASMSNEITRRQKFLLKSLSCTEACSIYLAREHYLNKLDPHGSAGILVAHLIGVPDSDSILKAMEMLKEEMRSFSKNHPRCLAVVSLLSTSTMRLDVLAQLGRTLKDFSSEGWVESSILVADPAQQEFFAAHGLKTSTTLQEAIQRSIKYLDSSHR